MSEHVMTQPVISHSQARLDMDAVVVRSQRSYRRSFMVDEFAHLDQLHAGGLGAAPRQLERIRRHDAQCVLHVGSAVGGLMWVATASSLVMIDVEGTRLPQCAQVDCATSCLGSDDVRHAQLLTREAYVGALEGCH